MKFEYDKEVDAGYLYVTYPVADSAVEKTMELDKDIVLDLNEKGKLLGIEILNASKVLTPEKMTELQA
ncbi:MAG: DUF2283 domain-containing protein [Candidatus Woesearchaeota archaeon]|nr:DUF2283 domain-containing protein [Candidatus Woesearchaeota archaeon]